MVYRCIECDFVDITVEVLLVCPDCGAAMPLPSHEDAVEISE